MRLHGSANCDRPLSVQGYEEVHVPAVKAKPFEKDERLIAISELKEWMHPAFAGMKSLNRIQSRVCNTALYTSENILMCAPTGAGKTNVAMLTILHEVSSFSLAFCTSYVLLRANVPVSC